MIAPVRFGHFVLALVLLSAAPLALLGGSSDASFFQAKNLFMFGNPANLLAGAAILTRSGDGISFRVYTSGLAPGAYTVWVVIFNRPENCAAGPGKCMGTPDLANPAVEGSTVYGTASVVGMDGVANFHGSLGEGTPPAGIQVNVAGGTANGLKDSRKAEIHLVVRAHGPVNATGNAALQLSTFEACAACMNVQAAMFEASKVRTN
jgi:hypothetical protein